MGVTPPPPSLKRHQFDFLKDLKLIEVQLGQLRYISVPSYMSAERPLRLQEDFQEIRDKAYARGIIPSEVLATARTTIFIIQI